MAKPKKPKKSEKTINIKLPAKKPTRIRVVLSSKTLKLYGVKDVEGLRRVAYNMGYKNLDAFLDDCIKTYCRRRGIELK